MSDPAEADMDDHWTRRQFGVLAGATLLVPGAQAAVGLGGVTLRLQRGPVHGRRRDFHLLGAHPRGLSCRLDLHEARIWRGEVAQPALVWLNDAHPFSRLVRPPEAVDLAPTERAIATLHVEPTQPSKGAVLRVQVNLYDQQTQRLVALEPLQLSEKQG